MLARNMNNLFKYWSVSFLLVLLTPIFSNAQEDDWFKYDDYNKIPKRSHRIVETTYRTNRGNEDLDAVLQMEIDFPHGKTQFDTIIRDKISSNIHDYLGAFDDTKGAFFYMPGETALSMLDYYGIKYINKLNKHIPVYVTDSLAFQTSISFSRIAETDRFVTYREFQYHNNPLYSAMAHAAYQESFYTYSKESYDRLSFDSIFTSSGTQPVKELLLQRLALAFTERREEKQTVADVLQSAAELSSVYEMVQASIDENGYSLPSIAIKDFPIGEIALLPNGVLFFYPKYMISYGYEGEYTIILPYNEILKYLRPEIKRVVGTFYRTISDTIESTDSVVDYTIELVAKGDYDSAEKYLQSAINKAPDTSSFIRRKQLLAIIQADRGENKYAITTYGGFLESLPVDTQVNSFWTESFTYSILNMLEGNHSLGREVLERLKKETNIRPMVFEKYTSLLLSASIQYSESIDEKVHYAELEYQIDTAINGNNLINRCNFLSQTASIYFNGDQGKKALDYYDELLTLLKDNLEELFPYEMYGVSQLQVHSHNIWDIQRNRAGILASFGNFKEAANALKDGYGQLLGKSELDEVKYYDYLSKLYVDAKQYDEAIEITNRCFNKLIEHTRRAATSMSLDERNELYVFCSSWLLESLPFIIKETHTEGKDDLLFNASLIGKGLKLSADRNLHSLIMSSGDKGVIAKYEMLRSLLRQIDDAIYENKTTWEIESLKKQYYSLERELSEKSVAFGDYLSVFDITYLDIYKRLNSKEAAIEFVNYKSGDNDVYYALALTQTSKVPQAIYLFSVPENRSNVQINIYEAYDKVWAPVLKQCRGIKTFYFAPSGVLSISPIESSLDLPNGCEFVRLSSTKQLLTRPIVKSSKNREATLFGGINYEHTNRERPDAGNVIDKYDLSYSRGGDYIGRGTREYLPGTLDEVKQIGTALNKSHFKVSYFTGDDGSESNFKRISGQKQDILHIATHGFYLKSRDLLRDDNSSFVRRFDHTINIDDNDLSRSGLLMAGANWVLDGHAVDSPYDDGILSSAEISRLDFSNTDLVVLSACQSGLGEVMKDGVAGLQRGFKKSGANTLLLSLWEVDDAATSILMKEFYSKVLSGDSYRKALREAQEYLREYKNGMYSQYKYWAPWIIID